MHSAFVRLSVPQKLKVVCIAQPSEVVVQPNLAIGQGFRPILGFWGGAPVHAMLQHCA